MLSSTSARAIALALATTAATATAAAAAPTPIPQIEQVDRATGIAGAHSLLSYEPSDKPAAITDDGRYAIFRVPAPSPYNPVQPPSVPAPGLYIRDIVANTTTPIGGPDATFAGLDDTNHVIGFLTTKSLDPADTNHALDLYAYERTTGLTVLLSRATGLRGAALGVTGGATIDRGTTTALFSNAGGVFRRNILAATITRVGTGPFIDVRGTDDDTGSPDTFTFPGIAGVDQYASADGKVFAAPGAVVTPTRTISTDVDGAPSANPATVSSSGAVAVWQAGQVSLKTVRIANTATGQITAPTVPTQLLGTGPLEGVDGQVVRITPDGKSALVNAIGFNATMTDVVYRFVKWTFATGKVTDLGLPPSWISQSEKFALSTGGGGGNGQVVTALAATGQQLPGTVDVPSPHGYVALRDVCDPSSASGRFVTLAPDYTHGLPTPASVRFRVWNAANQQVLDKTLNPFPTGFDPSSLLNPAVGPGAYRTQIDVKLADGRTASEASSQPALACPAS